MRYVDIEIPLGADYVTRQFLAVNNHTHYSLTPFDIPRSARIYWDETEKALKIEFKYLTPNEPKIPVPVNKDIELSIGQYSYKLYAALIKNADSVTDALDGLIAALERARTKFNVSEPKQRIPYWNYSLAKDFLASDERRKIASLDIAAAG